jgi:hypothetical protein
MPESSANNHATLLLNNSLVEYVTVGKLNVSFTPIAYRCKTNICSYYIVYVGQHVIFIFPPPELPTFRQFNERALF